MLQLALAPVSYRNYLHIMEGAGTDMRFKQLYVDFQHADKFVSGLLAFIGAV